MCLYFFIEKFVILVKMPKYKILDEMRTIIDSQGKKDVDDTEFKSVTSKV